MSAMLVTLLLALIVSALLNGLILVLARRARFVDTPGTEQHKRQARAVPYGGGIALALSLIVLYLITPGIAARSEFGFALAPGSDAPISWWLLIGASGLFLLGLWDDYRPLPATVKLIAQLLIIAAAILIGQVQIDYLHDWPVLAFIAALVWCVLLTNAYNLLDHADGMSASVACISLAVLLGAALRSEDAAMLQLCLISMGSLAGFLIWNWPPARLYLGDAGSLPLGFILGACCLEVTFWSSDEPQSSLALLTPLLVSAIPLYDCSVVVIKRLRRRRSIMQGDRNHISHRLIRLGMGPKSSLIAVLLLQTAVAASALLLPYTNDITAPLVLGQSCCVLMIAVLLEASRDKGDQDETT